jgi:replicative DNA helicase
MASPDITLLALLSTKEHYAKYKKLVAKEAVSLAETGTILSDFGAYFDAFPTDGAVDWDKFKTYSRIIRHGDWKADKHDAYDAILVRVMEASDKGVDASIIDQFNRIKTANEIVEIASDVVHGRSDDLSPIIPLIEQSRRDAIATDDITTMFGPTDLTSILSKRVRHGGLEWRLKCMNESAGPLHAGDFVFLAARPEAGKTSWLCSEMTHMVRFLDAEKDAVIFNPEEGGGRVFLRLVTAALGEDIITIASDESAAKAKYESEIGRLDRIKVVEPAGGISTRDIEKVLDKGNYGLVAINVLDKIKLPSKYSQEKEVDRYRSLAYWMREAANRYQVPILAVAQADASAEGQRYLTQSMLYGSKTGVQGEVDLLLGMGYDPTIETRRYISLLKNKLPGGLGTNPLLKHAKLEVEFDPSSGRYSDI